MNTRLSGDPGSMSRGGARGTPLGQKERGICKLSGFSPPSELKAWMLGPRRGGTWEGQPQAVGVPHMLV